MVLFKRFLFLILFVSGCGHVPKNDLAQVFSPIELPETSETVLAREFFEEGGWPTEQWWEMFEDPQLNHLIELALEQSPTLQKALAKVAEAEQEAKKERATLFPRLDFNAEEQWEYFSKNGFVRSFYPTMPGVVVPATTNQLDLTLNFQYEIDFFGRNRSRFYAALGRARAERAEAKQATLILTTLIAQTYIELQTKQIQKEILEEQLETRDDLLYLTTSRNTYGLDGEIPVLEKTQNLYDIEQTLISLEKEISLDRHMLSILVGLGPDANIAPEPMTALFERPFPFPSDLSSDLLARRPDLTAQIWRVEAAAKEIKAAKADFYPRVNLLAFAGLESLSFNQLFKISSKQGALDPAIHLPIFTGGLLTARLKEKVALFNEESYRYNELLLRAAREVADQVVTLTASHDTLSRQLDLLDVATDQTILQFSRYKEGVNNFLSVLEKQENLLQERYYLFSYQRDYLLSVLTLIKALGGGYLAPMPVPIKEAEGVR